MYPIKEVAQMLNISKESVYKKVQSSLQNELQRHIFKTSKCTLVDDIGVEIIRNSLKMSSIESKKTINNALEIDKFKNDFVTDFVSDFVSDNVNYNQLQNADLISVFKQQLEEKDKQIVSLIQLSNELLQSKNDEIKSLLELNKQLIEVTKNNQTLLKNEQEKKSIENKPIIKSENIKFDEVQNKQIKKKAHTNIASENDIVKMLKRGASYRQIQEALRVGKSRIARIKRTLN